MIDQWSQDSGDYWSCSDKEILEDGLLSEVDMEDNIRPSGEFDN